MIKQCILCNLEFETLSGNHRFCSKTCQSRMYRKTESGWKETKYSRLKQSARKRNILFDLSPNQIDAPEFCPVLGIVLDYSNVVIKDNSPSVDRIDNLKGYTVDNIQTISSLANKMKANATNIQLKKFADWIKKTYE